MPPNQAALNFLVSSLDQGTNENPDGKIRAAILGCGMMGQEHASYMSGFPDRIQVKFLCDNHQPSLDKISKVLNQFEKDHGHPPSLAVDSEEELLTYVDQIDLLVIATPNYMHTPSLLKWGAHDITILVEKPVAVSQDQIELLKEAEFAARIWVAMEYRFIPAIAKLIQLLPSIGTPKMVTIRENRYPFLTKVGNWNRDRSKTGDTLVEKWCVEFLFHPASWFLQPYLSFCSCHFFDLMRLITDQEANLGGVRALAQRGLNYHTEDQQHDLPIIDAAYVTMPFQHLDSSSTIGCLELCMYAEGSRHQEEVIVTGTEGRLEAYLPENKVYSFERPLSRKMWSNRSEPPPNSSVQRRVYDCSGTFLAVLQQHCLLTLVLRRKASPRNQW